MEDPPEEVAELVEAHRRTYSHFLRSNTHQDPSSLAENHKLYAEKFHAVIAELKQKIGPGNGKELPEYLGSGSRGSAYRITVEGKTYAVKFSESVTQQNFERKALQLAKGVPHTAQLVCYSFADNVTIMELLPGRDVTSIKPDEQSVYPDEHIIQLIETVKELNQKGIIIDPKPSNFFYDPAQGFSVLDFHLKHEQSCRMADQIMQLRIGLSARDFGTVDYKSHKSMELQNIAKNKVYLPTMIRFLRILEQRYPEILASWKQLHEERKNNPMMSVPELINRKSIPQHPDLAPHLKELEAMGY